MRGRTRWRSKRLTDSHSCRLFVQSCTTCRTQFAAVSTQSFSVYCISQPCPRNQHPPRWDPCRTSRVVLGPGGRPRPNDSTDKHPQDLQPGTTHTGHPSHPEARRKTRPRQCHQHHPVHPKNLPGTSCRYCLTLIDGALSWPRQLRPATITQRGIFIAQPNLRIARVVFFVLCIIILKFHLKS